MENVPIWHYRSPNPDEYLQALSELESAAMRNKFADTFYELGRKDPRLCIVVADISPAGSIAKFRTEFPERFVNTGVAEQIMIGMTAGMAQRGLRPFAYTIATFALYRPFEMVRDDLCYQNLPVTVVGIGGGLTYSTLGATHHAQEDVSIARAVPNLTVIAPCDPGETRPRRDGARRRNMAPSICGSARPANRILPAHAPDPWRFGKLRRIRDGADICILSYGAIMKRAHEVADRLETAGRSAAIMSVHTLKPLDVAGSPSIDAFPKSWSSRNAHRSAASRRRSRRSPGTSRRGQKSMLSRSRTNSSIVTEATTTCSTRTDCRSPT